jgi:hypothetical protein
METTTSNPDQISLESYLNELDGPLPTEGTDLSVDDTVASRLLRELATMEKAIAANSAIAETERAKITSWETTVNTPLQNRALWLRGQLEAYAIFERTTKERKTIALPFGTLTTRPASAEWQVGGEFIEWAKANRADLLRVKYEPDKTAIKSAYIIDSDGQVTDEFGVEIPGLTVNQHSGEFVPTIKPAI